MKTVTKPFFTAEDFDNLRGHEDRNADDFEAKIDMVERSVLAAEIANAKRDVELAWLRAALDVAEDQLRGVMHDNDRLRAENAELLKDLETSGQQALDAVPVVQRLQDDNVRLRAENEQLRSGYLADENGNEYVAVCVLKEKIRELQAALGEKE
jgi:regulator of replication initiation timing